MKFSKGFCLIAMATLLMAAPARADVDDGTKIQGPLASQLMSWVEREMGVRVPSMPNIVASRKKFNMVMNMAGVHFADARSLYIPGTVIMDNYSWDPEDPVQLGLLVHELAHHAQLFSKRKYPCPDAREYEAYTIQNKWLTSQGYAPFASQYWINEMSRCPAGSAGVS
ncbi:MAG: hypothetical protein GC131_05705 [Alphaproteobacteria bacterium]|nr:hypothetical protein [Alphaproteobacteria bacterium]